MKKLIVFIFSVLLFSCNPKSYVSDDEAIVESIENNKSTKYYILKENFTLASSPFNPNITYYLRY